MGKAVLLRRRSSQGISIHGDEYKDRQRELQEKARELSSAILSTSRNVSTLEAEKNSWEERISVVKRDLEHGSISANGRFSLLRLQTQAENAFEITSKELEQAQELHAKMKKHQKVINGTISRLDNIQYELEMDVSLNARRKELGMSKAGNPENNLTNFLRDIKQMEYTADALIDLRNENGN